LERYSLFTTSAKPCTCGFAHQGTKGNKNLSVSTEECSKKAIYEVFGSSSSDSANSEQQREHYPDMRLVGLWSDATAKSNDIVVDDNLNPNVARDLEVLRQYVWRGNDATNTRPRAYTDEEEIAAAVNYRRNRFATTEEPFTEVVSKATRKNLKKGFHVHNTRYRGKLPDWLEDFLWLFFLYLLSFVFLLVSLFFIFCSFLSLVFASQFLEGFSSCPPSLFVVGFYLYI